LKILPYTLKLYLVKYHHIRITSILGQPVIIDLIRVAVALSALSYAAWKDVKTREISDLPWFIIGGTGLLLDIYGIWAGELRLDFTLISLGFAALFALSAFVFKIMGEADALAIAAIALIHPINPNLGFTPLLFPPVLFVLSVVSNSVLMGAALFIYVLAMNLLTSKVGLFSGLQKLPLWKKTVLLVTSRKVKLSDEIKPPFHYPLEKYVEGETEHSIVLRPNIWDDKQAIKEFNTLRERKTEYVWVSTTLPFILNILLGYVLALVIGDVLIKAVSLVLG
jgi:Flp pilus assembly protein protease CpaA